MTECSVRAERFESKAPAGPDYLWEPPQKPVCVRIPFALIDRLGKEAEDHFRSLRSVGSEIGGVLFGSAVSGDPATICIADYELVACDYSRGPLYRLSDADLERFDHVIQRRSGSQAIVGYFRSHTRKGLGIDAEDLVLMQTRFNDPHHVALLIRPSATKTRTGGIFIWEGDEVHGAASHLEFPFRSSMLIACTQPLPAGPSGLHNAPTSSVPQSPNRAPKVVPITSRREAEHSAPSLAVDASVEPFASVQVDAPPALLRVSLCGLLEDEGLLMTGMLPSSLDAVIVDDCSYNVLLVDTKNPNASRILRERVAGAVIVLVTDIQEREINGVVKLRRPLTLEGISNAFGEVHILVARRTVAAQTLPAAKPVSPSKEPAMGSLQELAASYRSSLVRCESVSVTIQGREFTLYPRQHLYKSNDSPLDFRAFRDNSPLNIQVVEHGEADVTPHASGPALRRLDEFLWNLGYHAGAGRLLPWLNEQAAYRLSRWPPVVRQGSDSTLVKLATLMVRGTMQPADLCRATGIDIRVILDFLNGCSLVGCLEEASPTTAPPPARGKNPLLSRLLGRIRIKLGLT